MTINHENDSHSAYSTEDWKNNMKISPKTNIFYVYACSYNSPPYCLFYIERYNGDGKLNIYVTNKCGVEQKQNII
jgi:hypothetical protein